MASFVEILNRVVLLFFFASELIERKLKSLSLVETVMRLFEFFVVAYMLLRRTLMSCSIVSGVFGQFQTTADIVLQFSGPNEYFCLAVAGISCLYLALIFMVRSRWIGSNHRQLVCWFCSIMFLTIRLALQPIAIQVYFVCTSDASAYPLTGIGRYPVALVLLISGLYCLVLTASKLSLSLLYVFIPIIWITVPVDIFLQTSTAVYCVYLYVDQLKSQDGDSYLILLAFISFWTLLERVTHVALVSQMIMLVTILLTTASISLLSIQGQLISNKKAQIENYWKLAERKKESKLAIQQEFLIQQIMMEQFLNGDEKDIEKLRNIGKDVPHWERGEHLLLLNSQIQSYNSQNSKSDDEAELLLIRFKLEDEKRNLKTLLQLSDRYEKLGSSRIFFRYRLYQLMARLQSWFEKSKSQSTYIRNAMEIDKLVSKFYGKLYEALQMLKEIWNGLLQAPVDFEEVEDKYLEVLKIKSTLERLYRVISSKCEADGEMDKFRIFLGLLSMTPHESIAKPTTVSQEGIHPQVPYLIVKDGKIIKIPFRFIEQFGYSTDQLISSPIQMIVPSAFQKNFIKVDGDSTGIKFQEQHQLIIDGQGYVQLVNVESYLLPDFSNGIHYILFMNNKASQKKLPFLVYNSRVDTIEDGSRQFLEEFNVDTTIFQGQPIYGKDVFEAFDWNSEQNRKSLESPEGAVVTINLKKLSGNSTKLKVFLRIITKFEGLDKPRILVAVSRTRLSNKEAVIPSERQFCRPLSRVQTNLLNPQEKAERLQDNSIVEKFDQSPNQSKFLADLAEKKDNLRRSEVRKSLLPLTVIMYVFCGVLYVAFIGMYIAANFRLQWLDFMVQEVKQINNRNLLLSDMMMQSLTLYHLKVYPPTQLTAAQNLQLQQQAQDTLQDITLRFQQLYVRNLQNERFQQLAFQMKFENYNLSLSTGQIILIDFVWQSTMMLNPTVLTFMLDNYGIVQLVRDQIAGLGEYMSTYNPYAVMSEMIGYMLGVLAVSLYATFIAFTYRIEKTLGEVEKLYYYLPSSAAERRIREIDSLMDGCSAIAHTNQIGSNLRSTRELNNSYSNLIDKERPKHDEQANRQNCSFIARSMLQLVVLVLFVGIYVANLIMFLKGETSTGPNLINYGHRLRLEELDLKNSLVNSYYRLVSRKYKGVDFKTNYNNTLVNSIADIDQYLQQTPDLVDFSNLWWRYLNEDLCQLSTDASEVQQCRQVYLGILQQGFSKSIGEYQKGLKNLEATTLDDIYGTTLLKESSITQKFLLLESSHVNDMFMKGQQKYRLTLSLTQIIELLGGLLVSALLTVMLYLNWKRQALRIDICKLLFVSAPDEMLNREECLQMLDKGNLLDQLMKL